MYLEELVRSDRPIEKAKHWYERAAAMGNETAKQCLIKVEAEERAAAGKL